LVDTNNLSLFSGSLIALPDFKQLISLWYFSLWLDLVLVTQPHQNDFSHLQSSSKDLFQISFSESADSGLVSANPIESSHHTICAAIGHCHPVH